jgi:DNA helicase HerA-like ATPase
MLQHAGDNAAEFRTKYGNISTASVGAIQRGVLTLESQGAEKFFGEPALDLADLMQTVGGARRDQHPRRRQAPVQPARLFDPAAVDPLGALREPAGSGRPGEAEARVLLRRGAPLFNDAPKELLERIEQVVRLVRSKGRGGVLVTQNPLDVPQTVLGQLGNRVQHALRAFTPRDQQAVKAAATTFRPNPKLDVEKVIGELGVGEALVSFLDEKGRPAMVERAFVVPPGSRLGPITADERRKLMEGSLVAGHYEKAVDRESPPRSSTHRADERPRLRRRRRPAMAVPAAAIFDQAGLSGHERRPQVAGRRRSQPIEAGGHEARARDRKRGRAGASSAASSARFSAASR